MIFIRCEQLIFVIFVCITDKNIPMKILTTLLTIIAFYGAQAQSIEKISIKNKESFLTSCENGKFCTEFSVGENPDKTALENYFNYVHVNAAFVSSTQNGNNIRLVVNGDKSERVVFQKLFYKLGVFEIEILEGNSKGTYSLDDFLNLYGL